MNLSCLSIILLFRKNILFELFSICAVISPYCDNHIILFWLIIVGHICLILVNYTWSLFRPALPVIVLCCLHKLCEISFSDIYFPYFLTEFYFVKWLSWVIIYMSFSSSLLFLNMLFPISSESFIIKCFCLCCVSHKGLPILYQIFGCPAKLGRGTNKELGTGETLKQCYKTLFSRLKNLNNPT